MLKIFRIAIALILITALTEIAPKFARLAGAADVVVPPNIANVNLGNGDNLTVEAGGTVSGNPAVTANATSPNQIVNAGTITGTSESVLIINGASFSGGISNDGAIIAQNGHAIRIDNASSISGDILNRGLIDGSTNGNGIQIEDDSTVFGSIRNLAGVITATDSGIVINRSSSIAGGVHNVSGTIVGRLGIWINNNSDIPGGVRNAGGAIRGISTTVSVGDAVGIYVSNSSDISGGINNSGLITGDDIAILVESGSKISGGITNSGTIVSGNGPHPVGTAIDLQGSTNDELNLLPGSIIIGAMNLNGGTDTLNVGVGHSIRHTFDKVPENINTNGAPLFIVGTTVIVVNPNTIGMSGVVLSDLTGGIYNTVAYQLDGLGGGGFAAAGPGLLAMAGGAQTAQAGGVAVPGAGDDGVGFWVRGFGGVREGDGDGSNVSTTTSHRFGGIVVGGDNVRNGTRAGFFIGATTGKVTAPGDANENDTDSLFGGFYMQDVVDRDVQLNLVIAGGYAEGRGTQVVADNTLPTGIGIEGGSFEGYFATIGIGGMARAPITDLFNMTSSGHLRYAGMYQSGEAAAGLGTVTTDGASVHVAAARVQVGLEAEHRAPNGAFARGGAYLGFEGRATMSSSGESNFQGQSSSYRGEEESAGMIFGGIATTLTSPVDGVSFSSNLEIGHEAGAGFVTVANFGARLGF